MSEPLFIGIDESGRGCCVGPLVMGAVCATRHGCDVLRQLGAADSKQLGARQREDFYAQFYRVLGERDTRGLRAARIELTSARDIDKQRARSTNLNQIEERMTHQVVRGIIAEVITKSMLSDLKFHVLVDAQGDTKMDAQSLRNALADLADHVEYVEFVVKGDSKHRVIGAASIVAKTTRDALVEKHGVSGYPDAETKKYIRECLRTKDVSAIRDFRMSWAPVAAIAKELRERR